MKNLEVIILAAGQGSRMHSSLPKVLHKVAGKPMLQHVVDRARALSPQQIHVVYGYQGAEVQAAFEHESLNWVEQAEQNGTGHAVLQCMPCLAEDSQILILCGDAPLVRKKDLRQLLEGTTAGVGILSADMNNPLGYGRIVRDFEGQITAIVEEGDADPEEKKITEINSGIITAPAKLLAKILPELASENAQGEIYLTDLVAAARQLNIPVGVTRSIQPEALTGINNREQLAAVEALHRRQTNRRLLLAGVTMRDPTRVDIRGEVSFGEDVVIDTNVVIEGNVAIGSQVEIGPGCLIHECTIGDNTVIGANSVLDQAYIEGNSEIGPFARLRPGTRLARGVRIGNFVETKNASIGAGSKINHLSYVGDTEMGAGVNVGAGTITCNYDGANKHQTTIEDNVFVGSNTALVAPVKISKGATIGAGSTIYADVSEGELALTRARQRNVENWQRPKK